MNENHSKTVMTLQYEPLWKGTEGVLATKDVEQKPNEITERGCTTSSRSSVAPANICFESVGRLRKQIRAAEDPSAAHVGEHLRKGGLLRPLLQASRDRCYRRRRGAFPRGRCPTSRQSLFSFPLVPASRAVPPGRPRRTNVLYRTLLIRVCTRGSRSAFLPELIAIGRTLPAVHGDLPVQVSLKLHRQSSVLLFLVPATPQGLLVPRQFRQKRAVE